MSMYGLFFIRQPTQGGGSILFHILLNISSLSVIIWRQY